MIICGYCRAKLPSHEVYIRHDIQCHNGLERTRDSHETVCLNRWAKDRGMPTECICRIDEYEQMATTIEEENKCF